MQIKTNGLSLEVEDHGSPQGEPLVLIMGLGMQLVAWPDDFVASLVAQGFRVIRFDNRDIGLSQSFEHLGVPRVGLAMLKHALGFAVRSPYSLADMAADTAGVLDELGIPSAHICGASMGGMIAQHVAARHASRVKSLTLMMTSSGARHLPHPTLKVRAALVSRPPAASNIDALVAHYVRIYRLIGSPGYPTPLAELSARMESAVRRSYRPAGVTRQLVAIAADGDRSALLREISRPTQVIHGRDDPLVPLPAGEDLATKIAGARIDVIDGMGHDLPTPLWPRFVDGIRAAAGRA
jgi:pimeloyl-ACP methyl ester carboxylesterase